MTTDKRRQRFFVVSPGCRDLIEVIPDSISTCGAPFKEWHDFNVRYVQPVIRYEGARKARARLRAIADGKV